MSALEAEAVRDHSSSNPFDADFFRGDKLLLAGRTRYVELPMHYCNNSYSKNFASFRMSGAAAYVGNKLYQGCWYGLSASSGYEGWKRYGLVPDNYMWVKEG